MTPTTLTDTALAEFLKEPRTVPQISFKFSLTPRQARAMVSALIREGRAFRLWVGHKLLHATCEDALAQAAEARALEIERKAKAMRRPPRFGGLGAAILRERPRHASGPRGLGSMA